MASKKADDDSRSLVPSPPADFDLTTYGRLLAGQTRAAARALDKLADDIERSGEMTVSIALADRVRAIFRAALDLGSGDPSARKWLDMTLIEEAERQKALDAFSSPDVQSQRLPNDGAYAVITKFAFVYPLQGQRLTVEDAAALLRAWKLARPGKPPKGSGIESKWATFERIWARIARTSVARSTHRTTRNSKTR